MFVVMHVMGLPFDGDTIKEKSLGGSETAAYYVAKELAAQGHRVTLFTHSQREGIYDGVRYVNMGIPNEHQPLGEKFHFYAQNTPHDVLIIQRHPHAFRFPWAAKIKLWWIHDLGIIRSRGDVQQMLWNLDGVLTVSEYHKKQICDVYGFNPETVIPITNGIDLSLFEQELYSHKDLRSLGDVVHGEQGFKLLYTSRPERGLEHLLAENGIMERIGKIDVRFHLYFCGYDNTTEQSRDYYQYLWDRAEQMPNVTNLGSLTKQELADVMRQCQALVYPTPGPRQTNFNEVSCITAMEAMAAGLPFISTTRGALPETCKGSGAILTKPATADKGDGLPRISTFVQEIIKLARSWDGKDDRAYYDKIVEKQKAAAEKFSWANVADSISNKIVPEMMQKRRSKNAVARHLMRTSDIYALQKYFEGMKADEINADPILEKTHDEMLTHYQFAFGNTWGDHYAAYYEYEKDRGVEYGPEVLDNNTRFERVSNLVSAVDSGGGILDYGCAHGHYTINLAKRFPDKHFIGVDITASNIEKARAWAEEEGLKNVEFHHDYLSDGRLSTKAWKTPLVDKIIAAEVVEHVGDPQDLCDSLAAYLKEGGQMIITVPYGPWEAQGYQEHEPWRAHVHHFERADLKDMFGEHEDYNVAVAPSGQSKWGTVLGSYIVTYNKPTAPSGQIDYERKFREAVPATQTVSVCMIVKNGESDLRRSLESIQDIADEIIIGIDETTTDRTREVIEGFVDDRKHMWPVVHVRDIKSPTEIGFDAARNETIKGAAGDWILWSDADEQMIHPENLFKYLRNTQFDGYAIYQHHFAIEPLGVLKSDLPCRLFRNHAGIKFFGVVHEHPEKKINDGVGFVCPIPDAQIAHGGYTTEKIRRGRFDRNIQLLVRDREKYPNRKLGKYLWLRDLAQMCKYELEMNGNRVTQAMKERATEGIRLWEELLAAKELRMLVDGIEYYSLLAKVLGGGFDYGFKIDSSKLNGGVNLEAAKPITAHFLTKEHVKRLQEAITDERLKDYDSEYF